MARNYGIPAERRDRGLNRPIGDLKYACGRLGKSEIRNDAICHLNRIRGRSVQQYAVHFIENQVRLFRSDITSIPDRRRALDRTRRS